MKKELVLLLGVLSSVFHCYSQFRGAGIYTSDEVKCAYLEPRLGECAKSYGPGQTFELTRTTSQWGGKIFIQTADGLWMHTRFLRRVSESSKNGSNQVDCDVPPPVLSVDPTSLAFTDGIDNEYIDANDEGQLVFSLTNTGPGPSQYPEVRAIGANRSAFGVWIEENQSPRQINPNASGDFVVFLKSDENTELGSITIQIEVTDACGFGILPFDVTLPTRSFLKPDVRVVDALSMPTEWRRGNPIQLKVLVQNLGEGVAENVLARLEQPDGVICYSGNAESNLGVLQKGESIELTFDILIPKTFESEQIETKLIITEKYNKYAQSWTRQDNVGGLPKREVFSVGGAIGEGKAESRVREIGQLGNVGHVEFNSNPKDVIVERVAVVAAQGMDCGGVLRPGQDLASYVEGSLLGYYEVVERRNLERVLDEQKLALSGIMFEKSTVEAGCNIGAQGIIFTEFGCIGGEETIQVKLVDCQTSELYWSATGHGSSILDVVKEIKANLDE